MMPIRAAFLIAMILLLPSMTASRVGAATPTLEIVNLTRYSVWVSAERNADRFAITVAPMGKAIIDRTGTFSFTGGLTVNGKKIELPRRDIAIGSADPQTLTIWETRGSFSWALGSAASGGFQ
jgi:hypothetical protein